MAKAGPTGGALLLGVVCAFGSGAALAADRFASTFGSDAANDCLTSASPCRTIVHALTQAVSGDTIKIAEGAYTDSVLNIGGNTTLVISGAWSADFVSQDPRPKTTIRAPNEYVFFLTAASTTVDVTLDHLTIGPADSGVIAVSSGTGSLTLTVVDSMVRSTRIGGNFFGSAIGARSEDSSSLDVSVTDTTIKGNVEGGIGVRATDSSTASLVVTGATLTNNRGGGGGAIAVRTEDAGSLTMSISGSTFTANRAPFGGGALVAAKFGSGPLSVSVDDCTFKSNKTGYTLSPGVGGAIYLVAVSSSGSLGATVVNSVFGRNKASSGGAVALTADGSNGTATILNSTFRRNNAHLGGGAIVVRGDEVGAATMTLRNAILWGNAAGSAGQDLRMEHLGLGTGTVTVDADHCDIGDRSTAFGTFNDLGGNSDTDPLVKTDFHLRDDSPVIDAGTCTGAPATDFEGDTRPTGVGCDMGADEFVP